MMKKLLLSLMFVSAGIATAATPFADMIEKDPKKQAIYVKYTPAQQALLKKLFKALDLFTARIEADCKKLTEDHAEAIQLFEELFGEQLPLMANQ